MVETLQTMIDDGKRIANLFEKLTDNDKNMALVYLSALLDKELADTERAEKAGQEGKVKKILIRLLLRGRKRYLDIVWVKGKVYKVEIEEFIPAEKWVAKTKKALQNAELNSKQVIFSIEEQQIPFFQ